MRAHRKAPSWIWMTNCDDVTRDIRHDEPSEITCIATKNRTKQQGEFESQVEKRSSQMPGAH